MAIDCQFCRYLLKWMKVRFTRELEHQLDIYSLQRAAMQMLYGEMLMVGLSSAKIRALHQTNGLWGDFKMAQVIIKILFRRNNITYLI